MKEILPHIKFIYKRNIRDKKNIYYIIMMSLCSLLVNYYYVRKRIRKSQ